MKIIHSILFFLAFAFGSGAFAKEDLPLSPIKSGNILILLEKNVPTACLEVRGSYEITDPKTGARLGSSYNGKKQLCLFADGIRWGEGFPGIHQIRFTPKKNGTLFLNGIQYEGSFNIYRIGKTLSIVNDLSIESYLRSQLSQEFTYPLENEVMAAIAIAARTTAYYHAQKNKEAFWHLEAKEIGYQGSSLVSPQSPICNAIAATKDLILQQPQESGKTPFLALWTEHSAGKTASVSSIYRKDAIGPLGVEAPHAALAREESKWVYSVPNQRLSSLLKIDGIASIDLYVDSPSNKAYGIRIKDRKGKNHDMDFSSFQQSLGKTSLLSNDLCVALKGNDVVFRGYGKGLGVGLCLYSASLMAQNGDLADKILAKFYPQSEMTNLSAVK
jgi:stage II sporulation protein D